MFLHTIAGDHGAGAPDRPEADADHSRLYWGREGRGGQAPGRGKQVEQALLNIIYLHHRTNDLALKSSLLFTQ